MPSSFDSSEVVRLWGLTEADWREWGQQLARDGDRCWVMGTSAYGVMVTRRFILFGYPRRLRHVARLLNLIPKWIGERRPSGFVKPWVTALAEQRYITALVDTQLRTPEGNGLWAIGGVTTLQQLGVWTPDHIQRAIDADALIIPHLVIGDRTWSWLFWTVDGWAIWPPVQSADSMSPLIASHSWLSGTILFQDSWLDAVPEAVESCQSNMPHRWGAPDRPLIAFVDRSDYSVFTAQRCMTCGGQLALFWLSSDTVGQTRFQRWVLTGPEAHSHLRWLRQRVIEYHRELSLILASV